MTWYDMKTRAGITKLLQEVITKFDKVRYNIAQ